MKITLPENPRILITRTDRIGDLVLTTPLFEALRKNFPEAHLSALVFIEHASMIEGHPYLDEVIPYDKKGSERGWWGQFLFSRTIAARKFDLVIHAHATNRMHWMSWLSGIPVRIGYDRRAAGLLTYALPYNKKDGDRHEADYLFDLLEPLGIQKPNKIESTLPVSGKAMRSVQMLLSHLAVDTQKPLILLSPSASDESKKWSPEKFAELVNRLSESHDFEWGVIGTSADKALSQKISEHTSQKINCFCGLLNLCTLGALMQSAQLLISNDSGPVHIAAALGTPVVSIFGRHQPGLNAERWKPLSDESRIVTPQIDHIDTEARDFTYIDAITVDQVYGAAEELLR